MKQTNDLRWQKVLARMLHSTKEDTPDSRRRHLSKRESVSSKLEQAAMIRIAELSEEQADRDVASPTPEEIRRMTEQIRSEWTLKERFRRSGTTRFLELLQLPNETRRKGYFVSP